jgi:hypothetical protein
VLVAPRLNSQPWMKSPSDIHDWDAVQLSPRVLALETEQAHAMRYGIASMEEFCCRKPSDCVRPCGTCHTNLLGDSPVSCKRSGGRARGSARCRAGWLWERERKREAPTERLGAALLLVGRKLSCKQGQRDGCPLQKGVMTMWRPCEERSSMQQK